MNDSELFTLKENYCNHIIDRMDVDTLARMAFDLLMDSYKDCSEADLKAEILDLYDDETLKGLTES